MLGIVAWPPSYAKQKGFTTIPERSSISCLTTHIISHETIAAVAAEHDEDLLPPNRSLFFDRGDRSSIAYSQVGVLYPPMLHAIRAEAGALEKFARREDGSMFDLGPKGGSSILLHPPPSQ